MNLPGGRQETLGFLPKLNTPPKPCFPCQHRDRFNFAFQLAAASTSGNQARLSSADDISRR
jgi:hypothetical protein